MTDILIRKDWDTDTQRKRHLEKAATYKLTREASEEINPADTWISDSQPPELGEN